MALSNMSSGTLNKRLKACSRGCFKGGLKHNLKYSRQTGFTLIELIMVIVILGILSAFALPKFADFTSDAENASIEGALGGVKSAAAIAHASFLASGSPADQKITLEATEYTLVNGYPSLTNLAAIAGLDGYVIDTTSVVTKATVLINTAAAGEICFTYIPSVGGGAPPTFEPASGIGAWVVADLECK